MDKMVIKVGMADLNIGKVPQTITTLGLGSCVGIALFDKTTGRGGLAHIMLPDSTAIRRNENKAKFADTGIEELIDQLEKKGVNRRRLVAKIAGGAKMFETSVKSDISYIGQRNVEATKKKLLELKIPIISEDTGLNFGRTVELHLDSGDFVIKAVGKPIKTI